MVLGDVVLVGRPDICAVFLQIDLHHTQPRRMSRRVVYRDALAQIEVVVGECIPLQLVPCQHMKLPRKS